MGTCMLIHACLGRVGVRVINPVRPHAVELVNGKPCSVRAGPNPFPPMRAEKLELDHRARSRPRLLTVVGVQAVTGRPRGGLEGSGISEAKLSIRKLTGGLGQGRARPGRTA